jgi:hypothetical protein
MWLSMVGMVMASPTAPADLVVGLRATFCSEHENQRMGVFGRGHDHLAAEVFFGRAQGPHLANGLPRPFSETVVPDPEIGTTAILKEGPPP